MFKGRNKVKQKLFFSSREDEEWKENQSWGTPAHAYRSSSGLAFTHAALCSVKDLVSAFSREMQCFFRPWYRVLKYWVCGFKLILKCEFRALWGLELSCKITDDIQISFLQILTFTHITQVQVYYSNTAIYITYKVITKHWILVLFKRFSNRILNILFIF